MALHMPSNYGQISLVFRHSGASRNWVTTCGFFADGAGESITAAYMQPVQWASAWGDNLSSLCDSQVTLQQVEAVWKVGTTLYGRTVTTTLTGSRTQQTVAPQVALNVRKQAGARGRANQGRFFFPASLATIEMDEVGLINSGSFTGLRNAFLAFYGDVVQSVDSTNTFPVILHNDPDLTPTPITDFVLQNRVATQRRRNRP